MFCFFDKLLRHFTQLPTLLQTSFHLQSRLMRTRFNKPQTQPGRYCNQTRTDLIHCSILDNSIPISRETSFPFLNSKIVLQIVDFPLLEPHHSRLRSNVRSSSMVSEDLTLESHSLAEEQRQLSGHLHCPAIALLINSLYLVHFLFCSTEYGCDPANDTTRRSYSVLYPA